MTSGVYMIKNTVSGRFYVGSSVNIEGRWKTHRSALAGRRHGNLKLQSAWNKSGADSFVFFVLEECPPESTLAAEQRWLDELQPFDRRGYNICFHVLQTQLGRPRSESTKLKISEKLTGREITPAHKANQHSLRGFRHSVVSRAKMGAAKRGRYSPSILRNRRISAAKKGINTSVRRERDELGRYKGVVQ